MEAFTQAAAYMGAIGTVASGLVYVLKRKTDVSVGTEEWMRRLVSDQIAARDAERGDCTERIEVLTGRLDAAEDRATRTEAKVDECEGKLRQTLRDRLEDIRSTQSVRRELRDLTAKYNDLRTTLDAIEPLPKSEPPGPSY